MTVLTYEKYNKTKFAVRGDMKKHHSFVKSLNGRVNKRMKGGEGWLVDIKYEKELEDFINNQQGESNTEQQDDTPVFQSENVYENRFDDDLSSSISTITEESEDVIEIQSEDDSSGHESIFKELEGRERMVREREEFERHKEEFEREKKEREKEYEMERERERIEFEKEKKERERERIEFEKEKKEYKMEREQERTEFEKGREHVIKETLDQGQNEQIENDTKDLDKISHENIKSVELQEMLEYYRKFSKPTKPKTDKNYLAIAKIINKLNTRVTTLEHKYQKLKRKYSELKSNKR